MFLGIYDIDEYVAIHAPAHRFSSGAAYAPTSLTYSIYEEGGATGLDEGVNMTPASPFDAITGCYLSRRQLTADAGFERNKTYVVVVKATVDSVSAIDMHIFQIRAKAAIAGDAMTLTSAYDAAKSAAPAGSKMDVVDAPNATAIAAIQNGLAKDATLTTVKTVTDKLDTALEADGGVYRLTTNAPEQAPSGSSSAPTAVEIRQEMDANSTQLAAILEDTGTTIPALIDTSLKSGAIS